MRAHLVSTLAGVLVLLLANAARGADHPAVAQDLPEWVFAQDFEGELNNWTLSDGFGTLRASVTVDPLDSKNHVLTFGRPEGFTIGGQAEGPGFPVQPGIPYTLRFRYLRLEGGRGGDVNGAVIGVAVNGPFSPAHILGPIRVLAASRELTIDAASLIADGRWHEYEILFHPYAPPSPRGCCGGYPSGLESTNSIRVRLGVTNAADLYFDDISVTPRPASSAFWVKLMYPTQTGNAGRVKLNIAGAGFVSGAKVFLTRAGHHSVEAVEVKVGTAERLVADFDLAGTVAGVWNIFMVNPDGTTAVANSSLRVVDFRIDSVSPATAGAGIVSMTIQGQGLTAATVAGVKLSQPGGAQVNARIWSAGPYGDRLVAQFDLREVAGHTLDLTVASHDGQEAVLPAGITVAERRAELWLEIQGPDAIERARIASSTGASIQVSYGNRGNLDAEMALLMIQLPANIHALVDQTFIQDSRFVPGSLRPVPRLVGQSDSTYDAVRSLVLPFPEPNTLAGHIDLWFLIPRIPAQSEAALIVPVRLLSAESASVMSVSARLLKRSMREWLIDQVSAPGCAQVVATSMGCTAPLPNILDDLQSLDSYDGDTQTQATYGLYQASGLAPVPARRLWAQLALGCRESSVTVNQASTLIGVFRQELANGPDLNASASCQPARENAATSTRNFQIVGAVDPNDKSGPAGVAEGHYIGSRQPLPYTIKFENLDTATAPAKDVVVTDRLDPLTMDLSTFSLGSIAFGDVTVPVPWGQKTFETLLDLRPHQNLFLHASAALDEITGVVEWRMHALDPVTDARPLDPLRGFLPPNVSPPQGEGQVNFTVMPRDGLQTGTMIRNRASIVFDFNDPIETPEWTNIVDATAPVSSVHALAGKQALPQFVVGWSGTDAGSGVASYDIYVAGDGKTFAPWLTGTTDLAATFVGEPGRTYSFYSIASDRLGHVEDAPASADATTRVNWPPIAAAAATPAATCTAFSGTPVSLDGSTSSDPDGDPLTYTWTGPFGTATGAAPSVNLPPGSSTIRLVVNDGFADSEPVSITVSVQLSVAGFFAPLAALVPAGHGAPLPEKALRVGRTLPLKLHISCGDVLLTDALAAPRIAGIRFDGAAIDLSTIDLDAGAANDNGVLFRLAGTAWTYNLSTASWPAGTFTLLIELSDGSRWEARMVLR